MDRNEIQGLMRALQEFEAHLDEAEGQSLAELKDEPLGGNPMAALESDADGGVCPDCGRPLSQGEHDHGER